jgi:hypothetical protein
VDEQRSWRLLRRLRWAPRPVFAILLAFATLPVQASSAPLEPNDNAPLARTAKTIGGCWRDVRPAWPFYALPDAASLIVTLLLSIGLWAAIWEAVDLLASAVLH